MHISAIYFGKSERKRPFGRPRCRRKIILKCISKEWRGKVSTVEDKMDKASCRAEELKNAYIRNLCWEIQGKSYLKDLDVDRKIILKCISKKWCGKVSTAYLWIRTGTIGGCSYVNGDPACMDRIRACE
jgi:hypothetical protein